MEREFIYSKAVGNTNGVQSNDYQMGELQKTCKGLNLTSIVMLIGAIAMLFTFGGFLLDEFRIDLFDPYIYSMGIQFLIMDISDNIGKFLILFGMTLVGIAGVAYSVYCSFFKKVSFYKYGLIAGKKRILYADIQQIESWRVKHASLNSSFISVGAYNQFNFILGDKNLCTHLNSSEYNGMNDVMIEMCHQFSDIYIKKS